MKKITLLCLWMMTVLQLSAQDYRAYVSERPAFFATRLFPHPYWYGDQARGIREDSVWFTGSMRHVMSYQEELITSNWMMGCLQFDTSWTGTHISQDTLNGETWFYNYEGDTLRFFPSAANGQDGMICRLQNGDVIRGVVSSVNFALVLGSGDTVKTLILSREDSNGNPIADQFNGKQIKVARQHGIVRGYNWSDFPLDTTSFMLCGMENPVEGHRLIDAAQIYDFNVGDHFDYRVIQNQNAQQTPSMFTYYSWYITGKTVNGDTITYTYSEDYVRKIMTTILQSYFGQPGTWTVVLSQQNSSHEFLLDPFLLPSAPDSTAGFYIHEYAFLPLDSSLYNAREMKGHSSYIPYYWDQSQGCFMGASVSFGPCDGGADIFADGLGRVRGRSGSATCFTDFDLVYYQKGNETWGTPHDYDVIMDVTEETMSPQVTVYPNPAQDNVSVQVMNTGGAWQWILRDAAGKITKQGEQNSASVTDISVSDMASGYYILEVSAGNDQIRVPVILQ